MAGKNMFPSVLSIRNSVGLVRQEYLKSFCVRRLCQSIRSEQDVNPERLNVFISERRSRRFQDPEKRRKHNMAKKFRRLRKTPGEKKGWDGYELTADHVYWQRKYAEQGKQSLLYNTGGTSGKFAEYALDTASRKEVNDVTSKQKWIAGIAIFSMLIGIVALKLVFGVGAAEAKGTPGNTLENHDKQRNPFCNNKETCFVTKQEVS